MDDDRDFICPEEWAAILWPEKHRTRETAYCGLSINLY